MLFNSWSFAIFLPIVFALYWLIPSKYRWVVLCVASYYFYMKWNPVYVVLILFVTVVSYGAGVLLKRTGDIKKRKWLVAGAAVLSLAVLFVFKYYNFFVDSFMTLMHGLGLNFNMTTLRVLLPVGISFYTFQTLSYVVDVYRGDVEPERNFGIYATFVAFFPQLVAGPIERASNLLPQIAAPHTFSYSDAAYGLKLMAWGFFKKIIVADTLAHCVDTVYSGLYSHSGFTLVLASIFFSIQIYGDFSGYSDIAVGVAKLFGINLMDNFRSPYFATSVKSFWGKWHISLSGWFKDYLYIPLGGNRCGRFRRKLNLFITFLVSGIWHGANWTFVIWGGIHGVARVIEDDVKARQKKRRDKRIAAGKSVKPLREDKGYPVYLGQWMAVIGIFIFTTLAWIFFRAETIRDALYVLIRIPHGITSPVSYIVSGIHGCSLSLDDCFNVLMMVVVLFVFDYFNMRGDVIKKIGELKPVFRWSIYVAFLLFMLYLLPVTAGGAFIYFQF